MQNMTEYDIEEPDNILSEECQVGTAHSCPVPLAASLFWIILLICLSVLMLTILFVLNRGLADLTTLEDVACRPGV